MLHRVAERDQHRLSPNEGMKISPTFLQSFIAESKARGFKFVSLDELWSQLNDSYLPKDQIALVFDDGYLDNLTTAYPILRTHQVPFCIYITSGLTSGTTPLWWFDLEDFLLSSNQFIDPAGELVVCASNSAKAEIFVRLRDQLISRSSVERTCGFNWLYKQPTYSATSSRTRVLLSWEEIRALAKDPLTTIGAHTLTHPVLNALTLYSAREEICRSRDVIEEQINDTVFHLAYPFGIAGEREFLIAQEAGFRTAVTTERSILKATHIMSITALPRIELTDSFKWSELFGQQNLKY